ncbi:MAG: CDP-alcohol phosphatidyltransferase family protein [bacterium]
MTKKVTAWAVHYFTASGALCALYSMVEIANNHPRNALLWLMLSQVIDGLDGIFARKVNVAKHTPNIDGNVLDLVIDYTTCALVPVLFAMKFNLFQQRVDMIVCSLIVFVSVIWFSRKDIETKDYWFRGFPTAWNLVVTALWLFDLSPAINTVIALIFIILTITPKIKFFHIIRSPQFRNSTIILSTLLIAIMSVMVIDRSAENNIYGKAFILIWTVYASFVTIWRSLQPDEVV